MRHTANGGVRQTRRSAGAKYRDRRRFVYCSEGVGDQPVELSNWLTRASNSPQTWPSRSCLFQELGPEVQPTNRLINIYSHFSLKKKRKTSREQRRRANRKVHFSANNNLWKALQTIASLVCMCAITFALNKEAEKKKRRRQSTQKIRRSTQREKWIMNHV